MTHRPAPWRTDPDRGSVTVFFAITAVGLLLLLGLVADGAAKLRAALWLERQTGLNIPGGAAGGTGGLEAAPAPPPPPVLPPPADDPLSEGLKTAADAVLWSQGVPASWNVVSLQSAFNRLLLEGAAQDARRRAPKSSGFLDAAVKLVGGGSAKTPSTTRNPAREKPGETLLSELTRAAAGAGQIARGAEQAHREVRAILVDPLGRRALDRLLITPENVKENPDLLKSFAAYITPDGLHARIDVTLADRVFSNAAMDQVETLRSRLHDYLGEYEGINVVASVAGADAESADVRALTHTDQV